MSEAPRSTKLQTWHLDRSAVVYVLVLGDGLDLCQFPELM